LGPVISSTNDENPVAAFAQSAPFVPKYDNPLTLAHVTCPVKLLQSLRKPLMISSCLSHFAPSWMWMNDNVERTEQTNLPNGDVVAVLVALVVMLVEPVLVNVDVPVSDCVDVTLVDCDVVAVVDPVDEADALGVDDADVVGVVVAVVVVVTVVEADELAEVVTELDTLLLAVLDALVVTDDVPLVVTLLVADVDALLVALDVRELVPVEVSVDDPV
jgi:hypothetical protein